jgi:hypothetical protein
VIAVAFVRDRAESYGRGSFDSLRAFGRGRASAGRRQVDDPLGGVGVHLVPDVLVQIQP